ncbi:WW domain-binding protein 11 [Fasciola gigantica]|uniref:WW domain-binding protein 11 n=1 Tax=Fasciola gigantica TaxID=46835 RepID=A0A504YZ44_FASGI|nr:WW domain-binding protein 11 [Fasciola gigantica]
MGRRSVNTTKSGKFMNPTDQARKEARKRELKKNKKQRMAVRHAVLKSKDPLQLLEETALYDKQEYDPSVQAQLNERVIQEKRKRLLETFDRLVILYRKEDAEYANRLQAARQDYDKKRHEMMLYYEQVKLAERVKASEIPLPKLPQSQMGLLTSDIPLPAGSYTKGILKKSLGLPGLPPGIVPAGRKPPAPPPGPPPELSDSEGEQETVDVIRPRKIRFADADPPGIESESAHINVQAAPSVDNPSMLPPSGFSGSTGAAYDRIPRADGSLGPVSTGATSLSATSKDDAYEEFMREMEGLL